MTVWQIGQEDEAEAVLRVAVLKSAVQLVSVHTNQLCSDTDVYSATLFNNNRSTITKGQTQRCLSQVSIFWCGISSNLGAKPSLQSSSVSNLISTTYQRR